MHLRLSAFICGPTPLVRLARNGAILEEARQFLQLVRSEQPQLSIDWIRTIVPYQTPELMEHFLDGMRKAGLK